MSKEISKSKVSIKEMQKTLNTGSQLMSDNISQVLKTIEERLASIPDGLPIKEELEKLVSSSKK